MTTPVILRFRVTFEVPNPTQDPKTGKITPGVKTVMKFGAGFSRPAAIGAATRMAGLESVPGVRVVRVEPIA